MATHDNTDSIFIKKGLKMMMKMPGYGAKTHSGDLVHIIYDSSVAGKGIEQGQSVAFVVGKDQVIDAFDICVRQMKVGAVCTIMTTPEYAYGRHGLRTIYKPNEDITFQLKLDDNEGPFDSGLAMLPFASRYRLADYMRERGNFLFVTKSNERALTAYKTAIYYMFEHKQQYNLDDKEVALIGVFSQKCYNNLSATCLRTKQYEDADKCASAVLSLDMTNQKALYRKGMALKGLGNYEQASQCLKSALDVGTDDGTIAAQFIETLTLLNGNQNVVSKKDEEKTSENKIHDDKGVIPQEDCDKPAVSTKPKVPSWVKWAAGAAAVLGAGYLAYKWFK